MPDLSSTLIGAYEIFLALGDASPIYAPELPVIVTLFLITI